MYRIEITEITNKQKLVRGAWERVDATPDSADAYAPDRKEERKEERTILIQEKDTINLSDIIRAINGLK